VLANPKRYTDQVLPVVRLRTRDNVIWNNTRRIVYNAADRCDPRLEKDEARSRVASKKSK
jgi:hypothetical protein